MSLNLPPLGLDVRVWANDIRRYMARVWDNLTFKHTGAVAAQDGVILWEPDGSYPVVSKGGVWRQIVLADGAAVLSQDVSITPAAANTAYAIAWDGNFLDGITLTGSPTTDITFVEAGLYMIAFTAQISSSTSSAVQFRFWPRINGTDVTGSTMVANLNSNGATIVASRTAIFQMAAGDVLKAMWGTDSTNGFLEAHASNADAPASPSVTLAITRVKQ